MSKKIMKSLTEAQKIPTSGGFDLVKELTQVGVTRQVNVPRLVI